MMPAFRGRRRRAGVALIGVAALAAAVFVAGAQAAPTPPDSAADSTPVCAPPSGPGGQTTPTTLDVLGEVYRCILTNYFSGGVLDDRILLTGAFAGMTQELERRAIDLPFATLPALSGRRDADWAAFAAVAGRVLSAVPAEAGHPGTSSAALPTSLLDAPKVQQVDRRAT
jgi:carboxyl-terminal processing protease